MMTRTLLSLSLISAALTFMALLLDNAPIALSISGANLLLALVSLVAVAQSSRKKSQELKQVKVLTERSQVLEAKAQQLEENVAKKEQEALELQKQLSRAERLQESLQGEVDALHSRQKGAEAELQALRSQKTGAVSAQSRDATDTAVLQFLRSLQERGRFLDFAMAEIHRLPDAQVGAAARVVHQGIKLVLQDYFDIQPISQDSEGSLVNLPAEGSEIQKFRILSREGASSNLAPQRGRLLHRGWEALTIRLPQSMPHAAESARIIAPAEIDMQESHI